MKNLSFEEIVRNLLVYLKGQIPSMNAKVNKDEIQKQIQSISFTLRTSIVQLESATFSDPKSTNEYAKLEAELKSLQQTNARLEESLFLEMNKSQDFQGKVSEYERLLNEKDDELDSLSSEIGDLQQERQKLLSQPVPEARVEIDNEKVNELSAEIQALENKLTSSQDQVNSLRQALQNKEIELSKAKDTLMEAIKLDKSEIESLQKQLSEIQANENEVQELRAQIDNLKDALSKAPSVEVYHNNMAAAEAKISYLENSLKESENKRNELMMAASPEEMDKLRREKIELNQRIVDLEAALRRMMRGRDVDQKSETTLFRPEECVFLFDILSSTVNRLKQSPENKDLFNKAKEGIEILEKNNAISKVKTVGNLFDPKVHKAIKSFRSDFLEDNLIIQEESQGFICGDHVIQKALVIVSKSDFVCTDCHHVCRDRDFFCPKCGLELTAPDGTSKRDLQILPKTVELNLKLIDELIKQRNITQANTLIAYVAREFPDNPELVKRQNQILRSEMQTFGNSRLEEGATFQ